MISGEVRVARPDGAIYENTLADWDFLLAAAKAARYLLPDEVDPLVFVDRRNPDMVTGVWPRIEDPEVAVGRVNHEYAGVIGLPRLYGDLAVPNLRSRVPTMQVSGYDYATADQPVLVEVWIEKTSQNDVLVLLCRRVGANLVPAVGTQSITAAINMLERCQRLERPGVALYISDFDPTGASMPTSTARHLEYWRERLFPDVEVKLEQVALTPEQVVR